MLWYDDMVWCVMSWHQHSLTMKCYHCYDTYRRSHHDTYDASPWIQCTVISGEVVYKCETFYYSGAVIWWPRARDSCHHFFWKEVFWKKIHFLLFTSFTIYTAKRSDTMGFRARLQRRSSQSHFSGGDHFMLASPVLLGRAAQPAGEAPGNCRNYETSVSITIKCR